MHSAKICNTILDPIICFLSLCYFPIEYIANTYLFPELDIRREHPGLPSILLQHNFFGVLRWRAAFLRSEGYWLAGLRG